MGSVLGLVYAVSVNRAPDGTFVSTCESSTLLFKAVCNPLIYPMGSALGLVYIVLVSVNKAPDGTFVNTCPLSTLVLNLVCIAAGAKLGSYGWTLTPIVPCAASPSCK